MDDPTKKTETTTPASGSAGEGAKTAGAVAAAPAAAAPKPKKADKELGAALDKIAPPASVVVTGPEKGRWRIGRKFGREPVSIPVTELTEADVAKLKADPELIVQIVDAPH